MGSDVSVVMAITTSTTEVNHDEMEKNLKRFNSLVYWHREFPVKQDDAGNCRYLFSMLIYSLKHQYRVGDLNTADLRTECKNTMTVWLRRNGHVHITDGDEMDISAPMLLELAYATRNDLPVLDDLT